MRAFGFLLLAGTIAVIGCSTRRRITSEVVVRGPEFRVTRTISEASGLTSFDELWNSKRKVPEPRDLNWQYKLDVRADDDLVRWLYDLRGYTRALTVKNSPVWELPDPQVFNSMLGLSNQALQPTRKARG